MKCYTMIGSRSTPERSKRQMRRLSKLLCEKGYTGRSGGADGADEQLELGYKGFLESITEPKGDHSHLMEVYLPWAGFNGRRSNTPCYYVAERFSNYRKAVVMASEVHPAWSKCSNGARALHSRNIYQLLGKDLETPSDFVICYAKPKNENPDCQLVQGGTATAVKLGLDIGVIVFNLYYEDTYNELCEYIKNKE